MGTNYYLKFKQPDPCPHCGKFDAIPDMHIGKQSAGWRFSFHGYREKGITSWNAWAAFLAANVGRGARIVDEYGKSLMLGEFIAAIRFTGKCHAELYPGPDEWIDSQGNSFSECDFS